MPEPSGFVSVCKISLGYVVGLVESLFHLTMYKVLQVYILISGVCPVLVNSNIEIGIDFLA